MRRHDHCRPGVLRIHWLETWISQLPNDLLLIRLSEVPRVITADSSINHVPNQFTLGLPGLWISHRNPNHADGLVLQLHDVEVGIARQEQFLGRGAVGLLLRRTGHFSNGDRNSGRFGESFIQLLRVGLRRDAERDCEGCCTKQTGAEVLKPHKYSP